MSSGFNKNCNIAAVSHNVTVDLHYIIDKLNSSNYSLSKFYFDTTLAYNIYVKNLFVKLVKCATALEYARLDRIFLLRCRYHDIFPKNILNCFKSLHNISFHSKTCVSKIRNLSISYKKTLLNLEISDINIHFRFLNNQLSSLTHSISVQTSNQLVQSFLSFYNKSLKFHISNKQSTLNKKFSNLLSFQNPSIFSLYSNNSRSSNINDTDINKWVVNLSNSQLPDYVLEILSLGDKFNYSPDLDKRTAFEFYKNIESFLEVNKNALNNCNNIRDSLLTLINKQLKTKHHINIHNRIFERKILLTKTFLKNNSNLFVTKADKGGATIVIESDDYRKKVKDELNNTLYYLKLTKNPFNNLKRNMLKLINDWKSKGVFQHLGIPTDFDIEHSSLSRAYGLIKIHKANHPARIIVSSINSPTYSFDKFISHIFTKFLPKPKYSLKNSFELKKLIDNIRIPIGYKLISLDVCSLFTNLHSDLILKGIKKKWRFLRQDIKLSLQEFLDGISVFLNSTYFKFDNEFYQQLIGSPMGGCSSPWFAEIALEEVENKCLELLGDSVLFYRRYVDDCFLIVRSSDIDLIFNTFNNSNDYLKFTIEFENNNNINFLDLNIIRRDDDVPLTDWFQKPSATGRYINFRSHHPISTKRAIIYNLVDKIVFLSHPSFHKKNFDLITSTLVKNNYPLSFISKHIKKRVCKHFSELNYVQTNNNLSPNNNLHLVLPYVDNFYHSLKNTLLSHNIKLINKTCNKFSDIIRLGKDRLDPMDKRHVVYKLDCNECNSTYIGQTYRLLKKRMYNHQYDTRVHAKSSVVAMHALQEGHSFNFESPKILDIEPNNLKREFSEMLHILSHPNTLNRKLDSHKLHNNYKNSIEILYNK